MGTKKADMKLTNVQIRRIGAAPKRITLGDGGGLQLTVYPGGRRSWVYRRSVSGHVETSTLGRWPAMSLDVARRRKMELDQIAAAGGSEPPDPRFHRGAGLRERSPSPPRVARFRPVPPLPSSLAAPGRPSPALHPPPTRRGTQDRIRQAAGFDPALYRFSAIGPLPPGETIQSLLVSADQSCERTIAWHC